MIQYLSALLMSITYDEPALNLYPALKIIRKELELVKHITLCASGKYFFMTELIILCQHL